MKANRKLNENRDAISSFFSIMLFAAITVLLIFIVWIFQTEIFSGTPQKLTPSIGIIQEGNHILITSVQNGPVFVNSVYTEILNKIDGKAEGNASINDGGDGEIDTGDSIILEDISNGVFTVSLIYGDTIIGQCQFTNYGN